MSHVTCEVSRVMCHISLFSSFFVKVVELVSRGSVINGATELWLLYILVLGNPGMLVITDTVRFCHRAGGCDKGV